MKFKKTIVFVIIFLVLTFLLPNQFISAQSKSFEKMVIKTIKAFQLKKENLINKKYIHPEYGLIVIHRPGTVEKFEEINKINFNQPIPDYLPYEKIILDSKLEYVEQLPAYDCMTLSWNKMGLFCYTAKRDNSLSSLAISLKKVLNEDISEATIEKLKKIEKKSYRIICIDKKGGEFIFYLTLIDKKWYLTILDRASSECGS